MEDILHQYTMGNRAVCHECSSPSGEGTQLRKCGGCSIAIYCSKECQREAWTRRHRNECSSKDTQSQLMTMSVDPTHDLPLAPLRFPIRTDFPSPIAVRADFGQFRQHHAWALSTLIDAFVRLGWDHPTCSGQFDRGRVAVELYFAPVKDRGLQSTPANLWLLRFMALSSIEQRLQQNREFVREHLADGAVYQDLIAEYRKENGSRFGGVLLIGYHLGLGHLCTTEIKPVFAPRHPESVLLQSTKDALTDLAQFCQECINQGIVMKPTHPGGTYVDPGVLRAITLKSKKTTWEWTPLSLTLDDLYDRFKQHFGHTPKTTLSPLELMKFSAAL